VAHATARGVRRIGGVDRSALRKQPAPDSRLEISHRAHPISQSAKGSSIREHARACRCARRPRSRQQRPRACHESPSSRWLPPRAGGTRSRWPRSTQAARITRPRSRLKRARWRQLRAQGDQLRSWWRYGSSIVFQPSLSIVCATSTRAGQIFCSVAERSTNEPSRSHGATARSADGASVFSARRAASTDFGASAPSGSAISSRGRASFADGTGSCSDKTGREAERTRRSCCV
jgi:hypothetical protein